MRFVSLSVALVCASTLSAGVYTFNGIGVGAIPDGQDPTPEVAPGTAVGPIFNVTGVTGTITSIALVIGINHTYVGDLSVGLAAPGGTPVVSVFSRAGALTASDVGYPAELNGVYTFSDVTGASSFWSAAAAAGTGTITAVDFLSSTSGGSGGGTGASRQMAPFFASLTVAQMNGAWQLLFQDVTQGDTGAVTSASLIIGTFEPSSGGGEDDGGSDGSCSTSNATSAVWWGLLPLVLMGAAVFRSRSAV